MGTNVATVVGIRILGPAILRSVWRTRAGAEPHQTGAFSERCPDVYDQHPAECSGSDACGVIGTGYLKQTSQDGATIKQSHCSTCLAKL